VKSDKGNDIADGGGACPASYRYDFGAFFIKWSKPICLDALRNSSLTDSNTRPDRGKHGVWLSLSISRQNIHIVSNGGSFYVHTKFWQEVKTGQCHSRTIHQPRVKKKARKSGLSKIS
jgi:hypothetical protein